MSDTKHTPGPWRQGVLLLTETTRRWSDEERRRGADHESLRVFAQFSEADEGRSRVHVALVRSAADARLIAAAPDMYQELASIRAQCSDLRTDGFSPHRLQELERRIGGILAKAEGEP